MLNGEQSAGRTRSLIAPWWHTVLLLLLIFGVSLLGLSRRSHAGMAEHHVRKYAMTIAWEWVLLALTLGGVWLQTGSYGVRMLHGIRWRGWSGLLDDARAALLFWLSSTLVLGLIGLLLKRAGAGTPQQVLTALAPRSVAELALFLALSATAGFCEELVFRGYLMEQCTRIGAVWTGQRKVWVGAAVSSVIFGAAHLYEGVSGVVAITVFGMMFAWLAIARRSLRAGMFAHAWHDGISGVALYLLVRAHAL